MPRSAHIVGPSLAVLLVLLVLTGCDRTETATAPKLEERRPSALPGVLVSTTWLKLNGARADLILVDARQAKEYAQGHIPGAVNIPSDDLLDPDPANRDNVAPLRLIEQRLGAAGISVSKNVVIYDGSNYREAARAFWVFEMHGHPSVSVLNGGIGEWKAKGLAISVERPVAAPARFVATIRPERLATKLTVMRAIREDGTVILDARSADEYRGAVSKAARKGHIKKAILVDFERNLVKDESGVCSLKYSDELLRLYRSELPDCQKVICYCNSGNRASVSYLALRSIGMNAAVYDGSWLEWGNDPQLPIEQSLAKAH